MSDTTNDLIDRLETYAVAYGGLRQAVRMFLDDTVDAEFLAQAAEKSDQRLARRGGGS